MRRRGTEAAIAVAVAPQPDIQRLCEGVVSSRETDVVGCP
jgi:hypothetical protein